GAPVAWVRVDGMDGSVCVGAGHRSERNPAMRGAGAMHCNSRLTTRASPTTDALSMYGGSIQAKDTMNAVTAKPSCAMGRYTVADARKRCDGVPFRHSLGILRRN